MRLSQRLLLSSIFIISIAMLFFTVQLAQNPRGRFDENAARKEAAQKQIPPSDLQGWLAFKRAEFYGKQSGTWERVTLSASHPNSPQSVCANGDFEYGDFTGWQAFAGTFTHANGLSLNSSPPLSGRHTIMPSGPGPFDPVVGGSILPEVNAGAFSVRLGDSLGGSQAEGLSYTFTVTNQNKKFMFNYALVMEDAAHLTNDQPFFMYEVKTSSNMIVKSTKIVADRNNPYFKSIQEDLSTKVLYKNWDCEAIDLSAYLGQTLTIKFVTADCSWGGHFGYAYIDALCSDDLVPSFTLASLACQNGPIIADGSATTSETDYFWSIAESDQNGTVVPGTEVSQWFPAAQAGIIDLRAFYLSKGRQFKCNTYYKIKLAVKNHCVPWRETSKVLHISCPIGTAGPSRQVCCNSSQPVQLGSAPVAGQTYQWWSVPGGFNSSLANPSVNPPYPGPTIYGLSTTTADGCAETTSTVLECAPNGLLNVDLSTGTANFVKTPYGESDPEWQVRAIPGTLYPASAFTPTVVVRPNTRFFPWASSAHANWISPKANPDATVPSQTATANDNSWPPNVNGIDYFYEYRFFLDANQFNNVKIDIYELAADNTAMIYLNSQVLSGNSNHFFDPQMFDLHNTHNFDQLHGPFQITNGFVNGWNSLLVEVRNGGGDPQGGSPTGLLLYGRLTGTCK